MTKKWQSDDLFYIIMNEIHPRFNQFCIKNLLTFKHHQFSLIPLSMAAGVCKQEQQRSARMANFFTQLRLNTSVDHVEKGRMSHS